MATDDFNRTAEDPLSQGGNWSSVSGFSAFETNGTQAHPAVQSTDCAMRYSGASFDSDHFSKATFASITAIGGQFFGLCTRLSAGGNGYVGYIIAGGADNFEIYRLSSGSFVGPIASGSLTSALAQNDVIKMESDGSTHTLYVNDVLAGTGASVSDSNVTGGEPGVAGFDTNAVGTGQLYDDWEGANLSTSVNITGDAATSDEVDVAPTITTPVNIIGGPSISVEGSPAADISTGDVDVTAGEGVSAEASIAPTIATPVDIVGGPSVSVENSPDANINVELSIGGISASVEADVPASITVAQINLNLGASTSLENGPPATFSSPGLSLSPAPGVTGETAPTPSISTATDVVLGPSVSLENAPTPTIVIGSQDFTAGPGVSSEQGSEAIDAGVDLTMGPSVSSENSPAAVIFSGGLDVTLGASISAENFPTQSIVGSTSGAGVLVRRRRRSCR